MTRHPGKCVTRPVHDQVRERVRNQVESQVENQLWLQSRYRVQVSVWAQLNEELQT